MFPVLVIVSDVEGVVAASGAGLGAGVVATVEVVVEFKASGVSTAKM